MRIAIISRVYNEESILQEFLDYYRKMATAGFFFYDDGSTDNTIDILENDPDVKHIIKGNRINGVDSHNNQNPQRKQIIEIARKTISPDDYFMLLDVDEFIELNSSLNNLTDDLIYLSLFDMYITEKDKNEHWTKRKYFGPEVRNLAFIVKNKSYITLKNDRTIIANGSSSNQGFVKHVGKGISIQYWENKCSHYSQPHMPPKYRFKWEARKGKSIHIKSDFNRPLYKWEDLKLNKDKWVTID